jgi:hypothetical protein
MITGLSINPPVFLFIFIKTSIIYMLSHEMHTGDDEQLNHEIHTGGDEQLNHEIHCCSAIRRV